MKITVIRANMVQLSSENDADAALLQSFEGCDLRICSSGGRVNEPMDFKIFIQFEPRKGTT